MPQIKVTVYITSHNYAQYLPEAIESVQRQTMESWELLVFDDGSTDDTTKIAKAYQQKDERIRLFHHPKPLGLRVCANTALNHARGELMIRLDADDYFDENALLVLSNYLDCNPERGLVFPNWIYVDQQGRFLGIENRKQVGTESEVLDLPAHGACTMVRKRVLKSIGGYDPQFDSQDGHELWLKVLHRFGVGNVATPLFFYRQHDASMSRDENRLLNARQKIKRGIAAQSAGHVKPKVAAIIPAKNLDTKIPNILLKEIAGKPLIDYTLDAAENCELIDTIYVYSDDPNVVSHTKNKSGLIADVRPSELSESRTKLATVLNAAVETLEAQHQVFPDIVVLLSAHSPLRKPHHITKAIDTLNLYNVDNVISTYEDIELHFIHGQTGMQPINPGVMDQLRFEREALFVDNGAIHAIWREFVGDQGLYAGKVGHIVMPRHDSYQIKSETDFCLVEAILNGQNPESVNA